MKPIDQIRGIRTSLRGGQFGLTGRIGVTTFLTITVLISSVAPAFGVTADAVAESANVAEDDLFTFPEMNDGVWQELERKVQEQGSVAVIVGLNVPAKRPDRLTAGQLRQQNAAIAETQASLVREFGERGLRNLRNLAELPLVVFDADLNDLITLRDSRLVRSVSEDRLIEADLGRGGENDEGVVDNALERDQVIGPVPPSGPNEALEPLDRDAAGAPSATSPNGTSNQLPAWWDYYQIGVDKSVGAGYTGAGQHVAIIDTGVDRSHPWLTSKVVNEACFTSGNQCPNGGTSQYGYGAAAPCWFNAECAHGTHVAHTAAGTYGVAPSAKIVAVQVFQAGPTGRPAYWESSLVLALHHVYSIRASYKIAAVNLSVGNGSIPWTGTCDGWTIDGLGTYLTGWVQALKAVGIATVISSGNSNWSNAVSHPGCISSAVTVGNTTHYDSGGFRYDAVYGGVVGGSNSSGVLDLLAPGTDICSAVPIWLEQNRFRGTSVWDGVADGQNCRFIGTSMAAPHVAGAFAVLKAKRPTYSVDQILYRLQTTGTAVLDSRNNISRTRIQVYNAAFGF